MTDPRNSHSAIPAHSLVTGVSIQASGHTSAHMLIARRHSRAAPLLRVIRITTPAQSRSLPQRQQQHSRAAWEVRATCTIRRIHARLDQNATSTPNRTLRLRPLPLTIVNCRCRQLPSLVQSRHCTEPVRIWATSPSQVICAATCNTAHAPLHLSPRNRTWATSLHSKDASRRIQQAMRTVHLKCSSHLLNRTLVNPQVQMAAHT